MTKNFHQKSSGTPNSRSVTRRRFLGAAGGAAVGASLSQALYAGESSPPRKVRIGIVGGRFGASFQWHEHPNSIVAGVTDLRPERRERLRKVYRCDRVYDSMEIMLKDARDLDAVGIFTEAPNHVRHCVAAMKAGKHVVCAVPAAMTLEECEELIDTVKKTGLTYMMAETCYWQQHTISARKFYQAGAFGNLYAVYSMYRHPGLEGLWFENGKPTWRHGLPPMHYPTHCTAHLIGVTGERLVEVTCVGWGDDSPAIKGNAYKNPFWNETAEFKTDCGHSFRVEVWWAGAHRGCERAEWYGDKMSFLCASPFGTPPLIVRSSEQKELDSGGFVRAAAKVEPYQQPQWWRTDMLPKPLRHDSGHHGSHT
ncbi:MAG TPA: Gfo/Idh/MocA family oxidoreductase, partial [Planctomycetaceae bacterium]|nr:Gfo/Idh/MocA family oxidoreductase [Planctomycetaceae bacterium]